MKINTKLQRDVTMDTVPFLIATSRRVAGEFTVDRKLQLSLHPSRGWKRISSFSVPGILERIRFWDPCVPGSASSEEC